MARCRVYIQPFTPQGLYSGQWIEVTNDVRLDGLGPIQQKLDVSEYDVGVYTNSGTSLVLRNDHGRYSDVGYAESIFQVKRSDSLVRITWDLADYDYEAGASTSDGILGNEVDVFVGLLNDDSTVMNFRDQSISFNVLGRESIFDRTLSVDFIAVPPADNKASTLLGLLISNVNSQLSAPVLTIDLSKVTPGNDIIWDDLTQFQNATTKTAINLLLQASNSVLYLNVATPVISARSESAAILYNFYGPASNLGPENIDDIQNIRSGMNRTFNFVTWANTALFSQDVSSIQKLGIRKKELSISGVTTTGTQQSILDSIKTEFFSPKQEFELFTPVIWGTLDLPLLAKVSIDFPQVPVSSENLPIYDVAQYGSALYPSVLTSFQILPSETYKIIGRNVDLVKGVVQFSMRRV
jgi:hypothetical protein